MNIYGDRLDDYLSEELKERLKEELDLTDQQLNTKTARKLTRFYMDEDEKTLLKEAANQLDNIERMVRDAELEQRRLSSTVHTTIGQLDEVSATLLALKEAENEYGKITDEKAKTTAALYCAILNMSLNAKGENARGTADVDNCITTAGYVLYAFLGGQAKREINHQDLCASKPNKVEQRKDRRRL